MFSSSPILEYQFNMTHCVFGISVFVELSNFDLYSQPKITVEVLQSDSLFRAGYFREFHYSWQWLWIAFKSIHVVLSRVCSSVDLPSNQQVSQINIWIILKVCQPVQLKKEHSILNFGLLLYLLSSLAWSFKHPCLSRLDDTHI